MLILLINNPSPDYQTSSVEDKASTKDTVKKTLAEFEIENSSLLSKLCKLIPTWSMTGNLPMIPLL